MTRWAEIERGRGLPWRIEKNRSKLAESRSTTMYKMGTHNNWKMPENIACEAVESPIHVLYRPASLDSRDKHLTASDLDDISSHIYCHSLTRFIHFYIAEKLGRHLDLGALRNDVLKRRRQELLLVKHQSEAEHLIKLIRNARIEQALRTPKQRSLSQDLQPSIHPFAAGKQLGYIRSSRHG